MPSDYCTLSQVRSALGLDAALTSQDDALCDHIREASRFIDRFTGRHFFPLTATRTYDYPGQPWELQLRADLLSCTALTVAGTAYTATTQYLLRPPDAFAYQWIEIVKGSGALFIWSDTPQGCITVAGVWGWHDDYANAWEASGQTSPTISSTTATTFAVTSAANFSRRQTIKIDTELLLITGIASTTLTVLRGIDGTTAATHTSGAAISIYRPPADIEHVALRLATWYHHLKDAPFEKTANASLGITTVPARAPADVLAQLGPFRRIRV
jgi:hypothetical protein